MRILLSMLVLLAMTSCVSAPPPPPVRREAPPPPVVALPPPAPLASDWRDWPQTPGDWFYRRDARGSTALFGPPNTEASLSLQCDMGTRQLYLSLASETASPLTVRTTSLTRSLPVRPSGPGLPLVVAALVPSDPLLDAMAFSRGRFVVEQAGASPLVLPAWAEVERVIEDCRG